MVSLFVMGKKGLTVLDLIKKNNLLNLIDNVIVSKDANVLNDYYQDLLDFCKLEKVKCYDKNKKVKICSKYAIVVAWRWIITDIDSQLIVLHDSLLPKYRGFAPLVNMLIKGEQFIGVTAILANTKFDEGDIIEQKKISINYPIKINDAILLISDLYGKIIVDILLQLSNNQELTLEPQDESQASYSLWLDENDYQIDWSQSSKDIQRFIYCVGYPYKGAFSKINSETVRILDCAIFDDVFIENRQVGKVLFVRNGCPVIVCGEGLLMLTKIEDEAKNLLLPLKKHRIKFI